MSKKKQYIISLICDNCNKEYNMCKYRVATREKKGIPNYCQECSKKLRGKKISKSQKERYNNMSDEEKEDRSIKISKSVTEWNQNRSTEDKEAAYKKQSETMNNKSKEEKEIISKKISQGIKNSYNIKNKDKPKRPTIFNCDVCGKIFTLSKTSYHRRIKLNTPFNICRECISIQKNRNYYDNLTEEESIQRSKNITNGLLNYYDNLSIEEENHWIEINTIRSRNYYDNRSEEKREDHNKNISNSHIEYNKNLSIEEFQNKCVNAAINHNKKSNKNPNTKTEFQFANDLNKLNINFNTQYSSIKIDKDFNKEFPYNPIRYTKFINPCHLWDFIVKTKNGNIFIDVDGGQHNISNGIWIYDGVDVGKSVRFNDSQRYLQTDGLDSYVIMCHDDIISNDTIVYNINNKVYLTYKELLNHINYMNKEDKCINY